MMNQFRGCLASRVTQVALLLVLGVFFDATARAEGSLESGRDAALRVCDAMNSPGFRRDCREIVSRARTFSANAVQACGVMALDTRKNDCLSAISDRLYSDGEVASCRKEDFDPRVIECLHSLGRPAEGDVEVRLRVRDAIRSLERGYPALAEQQLRRLLDSLGGDPERP